MSKYDFTAPMMRCSLNDSNCFRHANQESSAIFNRRIAEPEWKRQQCDLVMQIESTALIPQNNSIFAGSCWSTNLYFAIDKQTYIRDQDFIART